ncbi:MFS transporter [Roseicyclus elongatus]|uniref:MFS transporter n=1 Tax=Roseicyclus elongatus TaxID=159346 RepID=UPI00316ADDC1
MTVILIAIGATAALWVAASVLFSTLREQPAETAEAGGEGPLAALSYLREDRVLVRFILTRGLLTATALAPPFLVLMAGGQDGSALSQLGALVLASALASFASSYVWGRLADRSSRQVLMRSGLLGALALALAVGLSFAHLFAQVWVASGVLFLLMIAYHGVRQGRSTYLTDMAPEEARAGYSAVANTVIGTLLLISGAFGGVASLLGAEWAVAGFCLMSLAAAAVARGLPEAEEVDRG